MRSYLYILVNDLLILHWVFVYCLRQLSSSVSMDVTNPSYDQDLAVQNYVFMHINIKSLNQKP